MLDGVNDSVQHADELNALLEGKPAKVNLIPFNPFAGNDFARTPADAIMRFQNRLRQHGLVATTRKTRGEDIDAACGQLAGKVSDRCSKQIEREAKKDGSCMRKSENLLAVLATCSFFDWLCNDDDDKRTVLRRLTVPTRATRPTSIISSAHVTIAMAITSWRVTGCSCRSNSIQKTLWRTTRWR